MIVAQVRSGRSQSLERRKHMGIRIRPEELKITTDNPFQHDLLDRKEPAELLTQLVDGIDGPCVMAIDAPWGAGKTTFLKMWSRHLRKNGFPVVEFNAWETDHATDPFVALVSELKEGLSEFEEGSLKDMIQKTAETAKQVALRAIPGLIRIATAGVLDIQALIEKETGTLLASYAESRLDRYKENQESIRKFRKHLQKMAVALAQCKKHPLMILIDELDRCRPSYAIALIEVAKHLFEADHVVFVLAVNRTQLTHSIRALYGDRFDASGYLRRFFDIDFRLPDPDRNRFIKDMLKRIRLRDDIVLLKKFFGASELSLRQVSQAVHRLSLATVSEGSEKYVMMISLALIISTIDAESYRSFVRGDLSDSELVDAMYVRVSIRDAQFEALIVMAAKEIKCDRNGGEFYESELESPLIDKYHKEAESQKQGGVQVHGKEVINLVNEHMQHSSSIDRNGWGFLKAVKRIDLLGGNDRRHSR